MMQAPLIAHWISYLLLMTTNVEKTKAHPSKRSEKYKRLQSVSGIKCIQSATEMISHGCCATTTFPRRYYYYYEFQITLTTIQEEETSPNEYRDKKKKQNKTVWRKKGTKQQTANQKMQPNGLWICVPSAFVVELSALVEYLICVNFFLLSLCPRLFLPLCHCVSLLLNAEKTRFFAASFSFAVSYQFINNFLP